MISIDHEEEEYEEEAETYDLPSLVEDLKLFK